MSEQLKDNSGNVIRTAERPRPTGAVIEVVERTNDPHPDVIVPNEVRINGQPLYTSADHPVTVNEVVSDSQSLVLVTLTLVAKRVTFAAEPKGDLR